MPFLPLPQPCWKEGFFLALAFCSPSRRPAREPRLGALSKCSHHLVPLCACSELAVLRWSRSAKEEQSYHQLWQVGHQPAPPAGPRQRESRRVSALGSCPQNSIQEWDWTQGWDCITGTVGLLSPASVRSPHFCPEQSCSVALHVSAYAELQRFVLISAGAKSSANACQQGTGEAVRHTEGSRWRHPARALPAARMGPGLPIQAINANTSFHSIKPCLQSSLGLSLVAVHSALCSG